MQNHLRRLFSIMAEERPMYNRMIQKVYNYSLETLTMHSLKRHSSLLPWKWLMNPLNMLNMWPCAILVSVRPISSIKYFIVLAYVHQSLASLLYRTSLRESCPLPVIAWFMHYWRMNSKTGFMQLTLWRRHPLNTKGSSQDIIAGCILGMYTSYFNNRLRVRISSSMF